MIKYNKESLTAEHFKAEGFVNVDQVVKLSGYTAHFLLSDIFLENLERTLSFPSHVQPRNAKERVSLIKQIDPDFNPDSHLYMLIEDSDSALVSVVEVDTVKGLIYLEHSLDLHSDYSVHPQEELQDFASSATYKLIEVLSRVMARAYNMPNVFAKDSDD